MTTDKTGCCKKGPCPSETSCDDEISQEKEVEPNVLPVDTGFAWVICAATFFITFLMAAYDQTLAVLLTDLREKYEVSVTSITLVFAITNICFAVGSVLSTSVAVPRTNERAVILISTFTNAVVSILLAFSPNIVFFLLMHIIKGVSQGAMWVPSLGLLEHYFRRRRSFATALCGSGTAFSMLVSSQMARLLTDHYGLVGTYLLLGALELHGVAAALLMRPVASYRRISSDSENNLSLHHDIYVGSPEEEASFIAISSSKATSPGANIFDQTDLTVSPEQPAQDILVTCSGDCPSRLPQSSKDDEKEAQLKQLLSDNVKDGDKIENSSGSISKPNSGCEKSFCCDRKKRVGVLSVLLESRALVSNWMVLLILLSTVHGSLMIYTSSYIPALGQSQGLDKASGTLLLTIAGAVNFVGMPLQGLVLDTKILHPSTYIALAQVLMGTICHLIRFMTTFPSLVVISVAQGLLGGSRISLLPVVAVEFVDVQSAGKIVGFNAFVATISLASHHPVLGYVTDSTGSFHMSFHYVGFGLYFSALLFFLSPVVRRMYEQRLARKRFK